MQSVYPEMVFDYILRQLSVELYYETQSNQEQYS